MKTFNKLCTVPRLLAAVVLVLGGLANAQVLPPDLTVCEGQTCDALPDTVCSDAGFKITLTNYTAASGTNNGTASYTYQICSPATGTCSLDTTKSCLSNDDCTPGPNNYGTCSRECAVDTFRGLSHFDVNFPELGGTDSCLTSGTTVTGTCTVVDNAPLADGSTTGDFKLGDGSCFDGATSGSFVAKCDSTEIKPGDCVSMTVNIAGETNGLGLGAAVVVDKESNTCTTSCIAGPSCEPCDEGGDEDDQCLTRTLGFYGTHPWITNNYIPVSVCGQPLTCDGNSDGKSDPSCGYNTCNDVMEGLGSNPGLEGIKNSGGSAYVAMVKQLTAAKLNLNATEALTEGSCSDFTYGGKTIAQWIAQCDTTTMCGASESTISGSGCIEALNAFNNSEDVLDVTPAPFDRPPVDDFGHVSGADSSAFTAAQGSKKNPLIIGKGVCAPAP